MENMEDKKPVSSDKWSEALYETLKLNNAYDKDYDTFYNDFYAPGIKGYAYRKDVYDFMKKGGVDLGATYEEFASKIGLHAIDPQTQQTPMGADSISKDMKPMEVTPTKKPEAKKEEKPEVSADAVSENQHPTDTLQDFNPNVSRMRNAGTDYFLQAAEEISNNAYSKSLEELANQAAKDLKKKAYQKPKEDSYVRLNQTARYIPIRSLPKDADLDSVFEAALTFENQVCGGAKEYTFASLGGDIQERYEKWKALKGLGSSYTQETASMSPNAVYLQAINLQALGKERPAWISELRWNEALNYDKNKLNKITAELEQEDQKRRLKRSDGAYPDDVSLNGMYHANYTALMASDIYNNGTNKTIFVLFQDGRIRPLQAPDPSILRGGVEAQRELFRRQYEKMTFGEEGKEGYTDPYEKNRVVGNFLQNGEVCHIIYFPYMIEQRRWDDAQELIKIGLGGKFNEEGVLLNPDDRLQIVPVVVKNGESEEDAIAKAKVELDNEISKKLPYKETYLQQQIAQAREALKKEQERLKQLGDHDAVKGSFFPRMYNPRYYKDLLESTTEEGVKRSDEVALARGNIRKLEESIKKYTQALEALRTGDKVGAWGGFLEGISDLDNWTFGLYNLRENLVAVKAHEGKMGQEAKDRLGLARSLSQESMSAFHRYGEGRFYGTAFGAGYSAPLTLGAIATYGVGNTAARGIIRGGSRMAAKYGTNWFFDTTIRATTRLAAINVAGVIDSSFYTPRIISDAAIEKMGLMNYTFDENQRIVVTGTQQEKSWGHSVKHAALNMLVQNVSERVGTYVLEPVAKAFGIGKINLRSFGEALPYGKTIHMIQNGAFAKAMSKVYGTFEKGGYDGFINEVLEEYIANPMTATFDENYTFADIFNYRQNLDTALSVWASSFVMLGLASTASSVKYYRTLRSVNNAYDKAEANARRLFGNENWDKIQNTILKLEGEPLVNAIYAGVCQNESLSDEQKKAFLNYVRAQKAQAVFNNTVSEKYSFSLTGEELEEMNAMTVRAYAEGRSMQTPQEYAQAQQTFADTREMAMSALGVTDDIDAYLDTLGETPAEQLKKGVEAAKENGLDEKAANAALSAYLNAREQQKGALDAITTDESIRRQHADNVIRQITFENEADSEGGSGKVILVNVKGKEKPVYLIRGRYENGSITGETVVVSEGNGVIEMIPASEVEGIVEESDAMTDRQREYDKIDAENKEQQRLINLNMDTPLAGQGGILMDEEGHRRQVGIKCVYNDEQGNPASVLVIDQNNNDYLIPIDVFREQRGRGRKFEAIEPYLDETDEEYHAAEGPMNEEYNLANKEQEGVSEEDAQGAAEGVTPQPTTDATEKPTKPEVKYDYHVKMKDVGGNAVSGRVTNLSADGVEIEFNAPYNGKMVDRIPLADFDSGVSEIADANGNVLWNETEAVGDTEVAPHLDVAPTQVGQEDAEKPAIAQAEQDEAHKPTALERIPRNENGEPVFEQAENPEAAWDALVEFSDGNAATAKEIADAMTEEKRKALEKAQKLKLKGKTPAELLASKQANAAELAKAESEYNHWQRMANVEQNRQNAIRAQQEAEARQRATERAEAEKAEREAREEAERREREALEGIPEWHMDTPENARKRGARRYGGQIFTRQEPVNGVVGKEVEVKFSQKDLPKGHVVVMEAEQLQPSHIQGKRNPMFFIEEAQPKNRAEDVSQTAARNIAENIRPQEITSSTTAYTGAPTINTRGEVIQGNNRSDALRYLWQNNLPKQQQAYKKYLLDQAEQLGLDSNAINAMQHPVLVNQLDVDDAEAIRLGQMTAQDTESGGVERIKPKNVAQKLGDNMRTFANRLLSSSDNDATFGQLADRNGEDVLNWMNQIGAISNTQYQSAFDSKGKLTPEAKNDLQKVLYQAVFKGGSQQLEEMFDRLPAKAQRAILSTAFRDMDSPFAGKMLPEIQSSIIAYNALMQDEGFASAKNMEEVLRAIETFKQQTALDDRFEQYMPADNFSNFALHLAGLYKASDMSQTTIASYFNEMYDLAQGKKAATLFEEADTTEYPLAEVIKKVLGIDYKPAKNGNNNVANGGADVALRNQESQGRQPRSNKPSASGEQNQTGTESSERGEGTEGDSGRGKNPQGNSRLQEPSNEGTQEKRIGSKSMTHDEAIAFIAEMEDHAEVAPEIDLTIENWDAQFGENGIVPTPIGDVKMGENQFAKLMRQGRNGKLGMIKPTLETPNLIIEENSEAKNGDVAERNSSYIFIKAFTKKDGSRFYYFTSISVSKGGKEVIISNQEKSRNRILRLMEEESVIWRTPKDATTSSAERQGLDYEQSEIAETTAKGSGITPQSTSSADKVTESSQSLQENGPKNSTQSAIESASAEVETSPTEAKKKAGNYKMGHVKVGAFDVTIENPKGSERSGTDANGKKWSVKMNNTYGYIRGTEGVDGDHIDVFLAEDMDKWDGKYVFVVDQYNPDGTFDEHKVMLGFNSMEEARSAYLSNYEKGWENGRRIVVARIKTDGFQKWVDSSHRKTKPFANYVIAGESDVSDNKKKPSASKKGKPRVSKEDEVKRTVEHFPMETPEEAAAFDKRIPEMEDSELLAYMQEDGKGDVNKAYHMNVYDEYDYRHTDEQTEAYNNYIQQLHDSNTTLEQAEEMLGNILGDNERFATDERSQLIGQSDALQDYITELERQKEKERAEAENSAENTDANADANHVRAADVAETKSAEPVEADKSKQYGEYQEVYDNFVSDVENRGMIPDLRAIKNKIRDTKRRLTVLRNGAAASIQSDEDLKRFETAEKKLTDLLHTYEAMRDYTEARVREAEAAAQRKPWSEKNAQERMDEASKNPLTKEEIQNAPTDEVNKANALDYLSGNHGLIQSISYLKVYEDVRNPNGSAASDNGTKDKTQLAGRSNSASEKRDTGGKSGGTAGRVDNGGGREDVSEQSDGGKSGEGSTRDNAGEGSNTGIPTEEQPVGRRDAHSGKLRRGGTSGRTRSDGGRSGRGESGNPATENGTRRAASESVKEESADDFLNQALGEFKDVLDDFIKAGRGELSISLVGLNSKQMEMLPRLIQVGAKVGYAYIRKGVHSFTEWANHVKEAIGKYLRDANLSDDEIDAFIKEMWKSKIPFDGQIHTLEEWASIYSKKDLRNKVRTTIEEKREAQRQAEGISVKTGDINNIRETLPFLLPQQQEDVLRAETQFFDKSHQDREHANGKGYMFTNGTGTGKTYTGLGIVKRFVKQGKKRILILTPSQPKVRDWINDGKNLGLEIKSLDDWAKERGTTATTEAGEGTIITTYANFRQNEELLNGTFDLIVYDESHRLMENKNAANTIGTNQHHMIANRDAAFATIRLRKINPFYQERDKVNDEFKEKREQLVKELTQENPNEIDGSLVSKGLIPHSTDAFNWHEEDTERFPEFAQLHNRFQELTETIIKEVDPQIEEQAKKDAAHTKVVFLSATPFNTRENIDYAQGYIFSYPDKEQARGYSVASPMTIFFEEHFGAAYKWRYGRLEHSERNAEAIAQQEREFSDWLQHTLCTMSGRIIDSEYDYSRDFPVVSVEHAEEINNAAEEILRDKYFNMAYHKVFGNYNYAGALFETLKVATLIPRIKQHLEAGRKVVIFHRRVESKTPLIPPFAAMLSACHAIIDGMKMENKPKEEIDAARHRLEELKEKWRGLLKWESMLDYSMPREQIAKAFGADNVLYFSGQESTKAKNQAVDSFNNDESGKNIIVIQEASGKEGISLHDTTGKHQRVLITLALPQSPITALQIEGRIYRIGNRSNAIFEYPLLGLNSEIILFGQKFNGQIGTTENLALGSQARNLRESFARSVEESGKDVPIEEQGFGGKEADAAERGETSPFDRAVLDYYGNQKLKGKRDSREGVDYYPTPEPLGFKMVEWGNLNDGETALEPSAGHGAIARYVPSANPLTAIEPSQNLFAKLQLKAGGSGRKFVNTIFEGYNVVNKHDVIFMNPPFGTGGRLAVDHVAKAFTHLTEGGRIVAIIPRGSTDKKFDKWIDEQENAVVAGEIMLPDITFQQAGTSVMARVLVIDKVTNQELRDKAESKYRRVDLSRRQYDKIEDFFEDIRDIQMPSRTIDEKARMLKRAAPALRDIKELKGVVDVQAQEDGIDIRTKGSAMGFYLDLTVSDFSLQQQLRAKYQRYAQEIEWNEHRHNEKAVEIYKAYNDLVCRLLGKTAEEVESDITREKMGLEQPHEEKEAAINVAPKVEESPSSEQNESTTESSPYHYELKHHTKTGAEMFMAMPNEKSGLSSEEYSSMLAKAKKYGGYWNRFMKGFAFPSEKSAKDFLAETGNTEQKLSSGNLYRQGEELSPNHEIRIVEGDENHGFKNYKEAKSWAKSNIARTYSNEETGGKGEIRISNAAIDKYLSQSAVDKSDSKDVHLAVLKILPDVIRESVNAEQHADYKKGEDGMRNKKNGINPDVTIHRLYGAVRMNGKLYRVKVTLKENNTSKEPKSPHSYEAIKIELLAGTLGNSENSLSPSTNNSITAANLLKGVEKSYGAGQFFEGYSEKSVEKTRQEKTQAAQKATENLNLGGRVVVHESAEGLEGKEATAKGWYDTRTGQIHVVLPNNADAADVTQTILHESVAHHGLRELFGHNVMDAFLDSVLATASQEVKDAINELRRGKGWNFRTATEEYLAGLAERTDFERMTAEKRGLFATLRRLFNRALEFLGLKNRELSDRELAYILWCSYQNLKAGEKGRYVAEAERIAMRYKLKAGKNAMTDTEKKEHSVLLRGELDNLQEILAKDTYERLVTSGSHLERTAWVDMLSPLQDLQHAIEKNGGFKLGDFENPYNAYITMSSRNYAQMDIYKRTLYADMIEAIHALGSETGRSYEEIKTYVMAKHGMERQKYMAGKAAEEAYDRYKSMHPFGQKTLDYFIDEYEEKSFAGLTELFGTQSVSDAMDEAQKYVDEVEADAGSLADSLWDSIRAATKSSLQRAYEAGLISKETYDNVSSMYQYYIPLRGFDETTSDEVYEYFGDQTINGGTGSFMKKAKGRKSVADDPFAVIGNMAEMAIMQSNRNLMKQQLLNLALNHPSDLISVSDLYVKFDEDYDNGDGTRGAWVPVAVPDTSGMTTEEANQVMLDFQDDMEEKVKDEPDTYALTHQKPHIPYRVLGRNMNEHQIMVKRGGKTYILTINGNPRAAQAINGLLNPDATENPGAIALKAMTNWIARMATARNVEFAISNAMRDLEFSTTLIPKEGTEYYGRYVKNYLTCVKNIGRLVNRLNGNTLDMSNPLEKAFYDFIYNGGETGYTFMKGVERYKGEITKALSELRAKEGKSKIERLGNKIVYGHHYVINDAWNIYMKGAEYLSRCTEDWVRFAVFLTSRQSGRSMEQSIMDAKEVTVNFNRKGAGSKSAGKWDVSNFFSMNNLHFLSAYAASAFKNFYAFSNASIQGLDKNVRLHLNHTAGMLMWDGAAVTLGMLSAMCIPLMLSAIGGDPDDYWDMPESMRRMGIMLPLGKDGRFLTLPMSIEHRAAYGIGELLGTVVCGSENLPASEITFQAFEQLSQILPLDLTEGNGSMLSLVPTAVRPEVEIAFNKNWLGMPIYKEPFNKNTPAFRNVYQSTNPNYIAMSKWLNEVQGGGDYERAGVQVNPAMVQHLVESYTGGAGKFVSRTSGVIAKIIQGEQIRSNEIPFYRTLVKSVDDRTHNRAARERFQREYDKGQKLIYKIDNYQKESARGNSQYVKELDEFAKSKDFMSYMLWKSYNSVKSQFDNAKSYIGDDKDKRAALDHAQMLVQKMMTECARAVEDSKTQEEADEKIGRIQSEYTPQIKETLSKVEE